LAKDWYDLVTGVIQVVRQSSKLPESKTGFREAPGCSWCMQMFGKKFYPFCLSQNRSSTKLCQRMISIASHSFDPVVHELISAVTLSG
jgi:hypothetical protein